MVYLRINLVLLLLLISNLVVGQTITHTYIDPCTKKPKKIEIISQNGNFPITVTYYGQVQNFTPQQLQDGTFDNWANTVYNNLGKGNPCGEVGFTLITDNILNVSNVIVSNVLSLNSFLNVLSGLQETPQGDVNENTTDNTGQKDSKNKTNTDSDSKNNGDKPNADDKNEVDEPKQDGDLKSNISVGQTTSSGSNTERQKPAILLTGDIVGVQRTTDNLQDSRITSSYIRMKGDKKSAWGVSVDFTVKAKIGNISIFKSWITTKTNRKHIDLVSNSVSLLPNTFSNTLVFIRVDNLKKVTWLYGAAAMYGKMYDEEMFATAAIAGGMYKGKITKKIDAVVILATIYVPYMKYYTEQIMISKPLLLPFANINYSLTKTFKFGVTGGTTYSVNENILNYQILFGAKLTL